MRRIICLVLVLAVCFCCLTSCGEGEYSDETFFGMDTFVTIKTDRQGDEASAICENCKKVLEALDGGFSRHIEGSTTYKYNNGEDKVNVSTDYKELLDIAEEVRRETDGAFSPAMGTLTDLWNVNGGGPLPAQEAIAEAKRHADYRAFTVAESSVAKTDPAAKLDFGAVGKGYAAQQMVLMLRQSCDWGLISLGGNVGVFGEKPDGTPFKIGITNPRDTSAPIGYLLIDEGFVSVSGDYERFFEEDGVRYHHILDPESGYPADSGLSSAAVWSRDGAAADALSTALFVMGAQKAMEYYNGHPGEFEAVLITKENKIILTPGLVWGESFLADDEFRNPQ